MKRGVRRSTFIISSDGVLRHVLHDVNPRGHAAEVFQLVKQLNSRKLNGNRQKHGRHA
jgi:peroxiredoxin Q/BCP